MTVETLQEVAKQVEKPSSISNSDIVGSGVHSENSRKCMELRRRDNPKDRKERRQCLA